MTYFNPMLGNPEDREKHKQVTYQEKVCTQVLRAAAASRNWQLGKLKAQLAPHAAAGGMLDRLNAANFLPVALGAFRVDKPVLLSDFTNSDRVARSAVWDRFQDLKATYDRTYSLLVFDFHGDAVGDTVLFEDRELLEACSWYLRLQVKQTEVFVSSWSFVIDKVAARWRL